MTQLEMFFWSLIMNKAQNFHSEILNVLQVYTLKKEK